MGEDHNVSFVGAHVRKSFNLVLSPVLEYGLVAQLVEHATVNRVVAGSNPAYSAKTLNMVQIKPRVGCGSYKYSCSSVGRAPQ